MTDKTLSNEDILKGTYKDWDKRTYNVLEVAGLMDGARIQGKTAGQNKDLATIIGIREAVIHGVEKITCPVHNLPLVYCQICKNEGLALAKQAGREIGCSGCEYKEKLATLSKENQRLASLYSQSEIAKDALEAKSNAFETGFNNRSRELELKAEECASLQKEKEALEAEKSALQTAAELNTTGYLTYKKKSEEKEKECARLREALKKSVACVNHLVDGCNCLDLEKKALEGK